MTMTEEDFAAPTVPAPWWHQSWKLVVMGAALVLLGVAAGYALFTREDLPASGSVDVGFLQDMRLHHDNAVTVAYVYLRDPSDPTLRIIAGEIMLGQQLENGVMVQLLRSYHQEEANQTGIVMGWMDMPMSADQMPGMVDEAALRQMAEATGTQRDLLFTALMTAHHEGGIHMADFAAHHADESEVRDLAARMAHSQRDEIGELGRIAERLRA